MTTPRNPLSVPGTVSLLEELYVGRFRWDLVHPFPVPDEADRTAGDRAIRALRALLGERVDPEAVERAGQLPDGLLAELQRHGFLKARLGPELGGLGLSEWNTFRLVEAAAAECVPVGMVIAAENAFGVGALLPHLPPGPLRELVTARLREGTVSGTADTEPSGAANLRRETTATATGEGYLLNGEKMFVSNAPIAQLLTVSATTTENGQEHRRLFVVDTDRPGLRIGAHEFMGIRGFPNGWIVFDNVHVPAHRMVAAPPRDDIRITAEAAAMVLVGRVHFIVAPALAIARACLTWAREFVAARRIDRRPLGEYDEIQRRLADCAAETFAIESVVEWAMLGDRAGPDPARNLVFERSAAKNIGSVLSWRVAERAMSLLAAEGYETGASKRARGAARAFPLERALRDLRVFRIAGGVDFQLDNFTAQTLILTYYYPDPDNLDEITAGVDPSGLAAAGLSERNRQHLHWAAGQARELARRCRELSLRYPDLPALAAADERRLILVSRYANEVLTVAVVLARAARLATDGDRERGGDWHGYAQDLADVYCTGARRRLADLHGQLTAPGPADSADYRRIATHLLGS